MFGWTRQWWAAWRETPAPGDLALERTIAQLQHCRQVLVQLIEEARLVQQLLGVAEAQVVEVRGKVKQPQPAMVPRVFTVDERAR